MADRETDTSASLLMRIRNGRDGDAWDDFVGVYAPLVRRYCLRKGLQEADAADVAQEVMLRVSQSIGTFEYSAERGRFRSWLGVIMANEIASNWTRTKRLPTGAYPETSVPDSGWHQEFTDHVLGLAVDRIREEYDAKSWSVFEATWLRREPPVEVAATQGMAIHAVYVWKSRILKRLEAEVMRLAEDMPLPPHSAQAPPQDRP